MKLVLNEDNILSGYLCDNCKIYNDILTVYCISCHSYRDKGENLIRLANEAIINRGIWLEWEETKYLMTNEKRAELHAEFFNGALKNVETMSIDEIITWESELEVLALKAKATLQGAAHGRRQKEANLSKEERERLVTRPDLSVSEGISVPKVRAERMSKADKLRKQFEDMVAAGMMTQEAADSFMGTVKVEAKPEQEKQENSKSEKSIPVVSDKKFTFNGTPAPIDENGNPDEAEIAKQTKLKAIADSKKEIIITEENIKGVVLEPKKSSSSFLDNLFGK